MQYFLSETRATQTENGVVDGLNPRWPPSNKSENPEKIGYPHLRLPLAINTLGLDTSLNVRTVINDRKLGELEDKFKFIYLILLRL